MRTGVGAQNVEVTLYFSIRRSQSSALNLRCSTAVCPIAWAAPRKPPGPEWYSGPVGMYTSSGVYPMCIISAAAWAAPELPRRNAPFGLPVVPLV